MKKSVFIFTTALLFFIIWACSESDYDFTHANPFDPDHVAPVALQKLEVTVEKIDRIKMVWDDDYYSNDSNYTFIIDKKIGDGDWQEKYKVFTRKTTTFTDSSAGIDKINYYRARVAYDQNISDPIETSIYSPFYPPNNINLNRKDINTIQMSWSDNSNGEDGFKIDRYASGSWNLAYATLGQNITAWTDSSAALNDTIRYRIYGYRKTTVSDSILTSMIINTIPAPNNLTIRQNDISEFELNWTDNAVGEQGFIIHRSIDGAAYSALDTLAVNTTNYTDPTVGKGKSLTDVSYRVYSYYNTFKSDYAETEAPITFPAPSSLMYDKISISSIKLDWTDNSISEDGFKIDRSIGGVWTLNYASTGMNTAAYTDTNAPINQTVQYRIYAYKGINTTSTAESAVITNTFPAPSSLIYSKLSISSVKLDWADNSTGEDGFKIDRSVGGTWTNAYVTVGGNIKTYTDANVPINQTILYRVYAYKSTDVSTSISTSSISNIIPAPTNPVISQIAVNTVRLDWTDNSIGEDGFKIDKKNDTGIWTTFFATVGANAITWSDTAAVISDSLQYRIYSYKGTSYSAYAYTSAADLTFPPPANIIETKLSLTTIKLDWTDNSIGETGFKIDRQIDGGTWSIAYGTVSTDIITWTDANAPVNKNIQYRIYGYTASDNSSYGYSNLITNTFPVPTLNTVTQQTVSSFKLDWLDNSNGEDGFKIERKIDDGTYAQIASVAANTITYTDTSINKKGYTAVYYRIRGFKGTDYSAYSEKTQTIAFPAPTNINYSKVSVNSINVTWTDNSTGEDGFKIDKKVGVLAWVTSYGTSAANVTSWVDTNAEPNTTIQYKVYAYKGLNTSTENLSAIIDNVFPVPTNILSTKLTVSSIKLNWTDNSNGETGFIIDRKVGVENWTAGYDTTAANAVTWTDASAIINSTLQYRIKAYKDSYGSSSLETTVIDNAIPPPTNLITSINGMNIILTWQDNSAGEDGFKIDRMVGDGVWVDNYASLGSNIITWNETVADTGKYNYRIRTYKSTNSSIASSVAQAGIYQAYNPMILVPGGSYQMGQVGVAEPVHSVTLSHSFYMAKFETTQKEWIDVMGTNPTIGFEIYGTGNEYPIFNVGLYDIIVYCNKKSILEGLNPCYLINSSTNPDDWGAIPSIYDAQWEAVECRWYENGYRLPTEAEWEYTARYNDGRTYPWGSTTPSNTLCNYNYNAVNNATAVVGSYPDGNSKLGLCDLAGNVWEFVWDSYSIYDTISQTDPTGGTSSEHRTLRGGNYNDDSNRIKSAFRIAWETPGESYNVGFRVARSNISIAAPSNLSSSLNSKKEIVLTWTDNSNRENGYVIDKKSDESSTWELNYASVGANTSTWTDPESSIGIYYYRVRAYISIYYSNYSNELSATIEPSMILVPAGTFQMGQVGVAEPVHEVTITHSFYMAKYETTQKEWSDIMGSSPATGYGVGDNYPVYYVCWYDILVYCNKRSLAEGLNPCYVINDATDPSVWGSVPTAQDATWDAVECRWYENGYRLPTEAEREYAARYNDGRTYPWGETAPSSTLCNYDGNVVSTTAVGSYPSGNSNLGLYDMAGNVWEWVWDWYEAYPNTPQTDPNGSDSTQIYRVLRGGGWGSSEAGIQCAYRPYDTPYNRNHFGGFRVARNNPVDPRPVTYFKEYNEGWTEGDDSHLLTSDGSVIMSGINYDGARLIKADKYGNKEWVQIIGNDNTNKIFSIIETSDKGFMLSGWIYYPEYYQFIKTDANGNTMWGKSNPNISKVSSIQQTSDGGYIMCGYMLHTNIEYGVILKTDSLGNEEWHKEYEQYSNLKKIIKTRDNNFVAVGCKLNNPYYEVYLVKIDIEGNVILTKNYAIGITSEAYNVQETTDNGFIITGISATGTTDSDGFLLRADSEGNKIWSNSYIGNLSDYLISVKQTPDGDFVACGWTNSFGFGHDIWFVKTDYSGNLIFNKTFGIAADGEGGNTISVSSDNGYVITGGRGPDIKAVINIKTDSNGNVMGK